MPFRSSKTAYPIEPTRWRALPFWVALGAANSAVLAVLAVMALRNGERRWAIASAFAAWMIGYFMILQKRRIDRLRRKVAEEVAKHEAALAASQD